MKFYSTRDVSKKEYSPCEVIKLGLAPDGGLFVPERIPVLSLGELGGLCSLSYPELSARILSYFFTDFTYDELLCDCLAAYSVEKFSPEVCPTVKVGDATYVLELWHGPSCAFKDVALQLMPRLFSRALAKTGESRRALVLTATSGDTGKAALEGYSGVDGTDIAVFFPDGGTSETQRLQMVTQAGDNVLVSAVLGNFDDIQTEVKRIFSDEDMRARLSELGYFLTSANSINFARLAPQIPYYFKAYCDMLARGEISLGDRISICVPTGNFGNIFAAYIASLMGLPVGRLICASNANSVLTDFLRSGRYDRNRSFYTTASPSMDILVSSNLERLIYFVCGAERTSKYMSELMSGGVYALAPDELERIREVFLGYCADDEATARTIKHYYTDMGYLADTHTAVALAALDEYRAEHPLSVTEKVVVASTASPYKFAESVYYAISGVASPSGSRSLITLSEATGIEIPEPLLGLDRRAVRFSSSVEPRYLADMILEYAGGKK